MSDSLVMLLHLCDSQFPLGAFAHSDGLETATSLGHIADAAGLQGWIETTISQPLAHTEAPAVARAWSAWAHRDRGGVFALDEEVIALRPSSSGRDASLAMGTRLLRTWSAIHPSHLLPGIEEPRSQLSLPVAFGVVATAAGIRVEAAVQGFIYSRLAATVSAAMRLMPLGQHDAHRLLANFAVRAPKIAADVLSDQSPLGGFAPGLDLAAMGQQYVTSRLFRS